MAEPQSIDPNNLGDIVASKAQEQGWQHPLTDFSGKFVILDGEMKETKDAEKRSFLATTMKFDDVVVHASRFTYGHPTAEINLVYNDSPTSAWGIMANSIAVIMGEDTKMSSLYGKTLRMTETSGHIARRPTKQPPGKDDWEDYERNCWEVVEIEGVGKPADATVATASNGSDVTDLNDLQAAVKIADGKDLAGFSRGVLTETGVSETLKKLAITGTEQEYLNNLVTAGELSVDDAGVYHTASKTAKAKK